MNFGQNKQVIVFLHLKKSTISYLRNKER